MERKTIVFILLLISALALCIASIWMLVDTPPFQGSKRGTIDPPKVGIAAGILAAVVGIAIFCFKDIQERKNVMMAAVFVVLIFGITTFALALDEHLDFKRILDASDSAVQFLTQDRGRNFRDSQGTGRQSQPQFSDWEIQIFFDALDMICKLNNQLIGLLVAGAIAIVLEIAALIIVYLFQESHTTRNALPMEKPY